MTARTTRSRSLALVMWCEAGKSAKSSSASGAIASSSASSASASTARAAASSPSSPAPGGSAPRGGGILHTPRSSRRSARLTVPVPWKAVSLATSSAAS